MKQQKSTPASTIENLERRELFATIVVTNVNNSGAGSLRDAISLANKYTDHDTIKFNIGWGAKSIQPLTALPYIRSPLTIDGTTQPGFAGKPIIELNGSKAGYAVGLNVGGGNSTIKGLVINRFNGIGIQVVNGGGNKIAGNYIGTDLTGSYAAPNAQKGVFLQTANNVVGGTTAADRNVISGNNSIGVQMWTYSAKYNKVQGNYIGTDATGNKAVPNKGSGVAINGSPFNLVGGSVAGAGNVISGNTEDGVVINQGGGHDTVIRGNIIGLNARGDTRLGNGWYGIETSQPRTIIGGTTAIERNVVSGNVWSGIVLWLASGSDNKVTGNYVGTDVTGTRDIGNWWRGIDVSNGSSNNVIGGYSAAERNVISGNDDSGVLVYQGTNNQFINNYVGFAPNGTTAVGNFGNGFSVYQANATLIKNNKIGNNSGYAVHNGGSTGTIVTGNTLVNDVLFLVKAV
jgi:hypothetical protein